MRLQHFTVIALSAVILESCKNLPQSTQVKIEQEPNLLQIGDNSFSTADFIASYEKNKINHETDQPLSLTEYLDLYTNMKLKVLSSITNGNDTTSDYKDEITTYRDILSKGYLTDKALAEKFTKEAYARLQEEVQASHILISVPELAASEDTLSAYNAAVALIGRLNEGADFSEMAFQYSKDPSAKKNRGDLGNFSVFQMIYPLENAAYTAPIGKITGPIRSPRGYHILKVKSRKPNRGKIQVAHCMVRLLPGSNAAETKRAEEKIQKAYIRLNNGEDWAKVINELSEDKQSANKQGILPAFTIGTMVKPFEDAAYSIKNAGEYSKPVLTEFGWHIIKLVQKFPKESFEDLETSLNQKVLTDTRGRLIEKSVAAQLRDKLRPVENTQVLSTLRLNVDSTIITGKWQPASILAPAQLEAPILTIGKQQIPTATFVDYVKQKQRPVAASSSKTLVFDKYFRDFSDAQLIRYEKENLEESNPEFKHLFSEVKDGVLLSKMMEKNVWQKSLSDTTEQRSLYNQNVNKYVYPERVNGFIVETNSEELTKTVISMLSSFPYQVETQGQPLFFTNNSATLTQEGIMSLQNVVSVMIGNASYELEVNGYQTSSESANVAANRIESVVKYLTDAGVSMNRIIEKNHNTLRTFETPAATRRVSFIFASQNAQDIAKVLNKTKANSVIIKEGYFTKDEPWIKGFEWKEGKQVKTTNGKSLALLVNKIEAPRNKTFAEARGAVINEYQQILEKKWLEQLKSQYPVKVNEEELKRISN